MIGFFRRIRKKLADDNKPMKYMRYAVGEIVLVMVGILLALQVNNWNEQRKMDLKEKSFLVVIHEEFLKNKIQLDLALSQHKKALQSCEKLIALFPLDVKTNNLDSIGLYIYNSKNAPTFNPSQGSINSIISTSSFDIIHNNELRNLLISWPDLLIDYQEDEIEARRTLDNLIDPYFSKNFDYNFNLRDKRNKLESLESLELEYLIKIRHQYILYIIGERSQLPTLTKSISEIIRLSKN